MKKTFLSGPIVAALLALAFPVAAFAAVGVGVGIGKISLDQPVKPGGIYELPILPVLNTGDEPGDYEVTVEFQENVPQERPAREWFNFDPQHFSLEPGKVQPVKVTLNVPVKTKPGEYFAYLEAHPVKRAAGQGGASIGVAAAAKLYFTVAPANIFAGVAYRAASLMTRYSPWTYVGLGLLAAAALVLFMKKHFKFQLAVTRKK